jgi:hypothetical protein
MVGMWSVRDHHVKEFMEEGRKFEWNPESVVSCQQDLTLLSVLCKPQRPTQLRGPAWRRQDIQRVTNVACRLLAESTYSSFLLIHALAKIFLRSQSAHTSIIDQLVGHSKAAGRKLDRPSSKSNYSEYLSDMRSQQIFFCLRTLLIKAL